MSTALANTGHNCNLAAEAESLIMAKERLVERYGDVRYTIGTGCSGGSIVQQTVANAYPGVYDGLVITCAYPDVLTAGAQFADYHLLRQYFEDPSKWGPGVVWPPAQWGLVEGRPDRSTRSSPTRGSSRRDHPVGDCVPADQAYDPARAGRRALLDPRLHDQRARPAPADVWSAMEKAAGHGFAGQPFGNAGIQYGLQSSSRA